jgi:fucose 4-O-acetylase-like acetyltransferase
MQPQSKSYSAPTANTVPATKRLSEIDTAKGIGIALVVLGHMVARDVKPQGNDWWLVFHEHLYSFHMAFFFFLSGYVFFLHPTDQWVGRLRKTASKLVPAYLLFALIVYLAKFLAVRFLHVDRPVKHPLDEMLFMLAYPTESFAQFLWFIVTLLMIYTLMSVFRVWVTRYLGAALAVFFALHVLSVTDHVTSFLALQQLARYAIFFLLAAVCHRHLATWMTAVTRFGTMIFLAFIGTLIILPYEWLPTMAGLLSLPAMLALAVRVDHWPAVREPLQFLGRNTLTIYLMSSLAMGFVRAIVLKTWGWDDWHFFLAVPLLLAAGLLVPIAVQRLLFARWSWTDRITR